MIHILCVLLKTIGWMILGIFGVILGLLLLVLFSAIRYKVAGRKQGQVLEGQIKVTWLLWILSLLITYKKGLEVRVKLFGWTVKRLELGTGADGQQEAGESAPAQELEPNDAGQGPPGYPVIEQGQEELFAGGMDVLCQQEGDRSDQSGADRSDQSGADRSDQSGADRKKALEDGWRTGPVEPESTGDVRSDRVEDPRHVYVQEEPTAGRDQGAGRSHGPAGLARRLWDKLCALYQKLLAWIRGLGHKVGTVREKVGQVLEKGEKLQAFLQDPANHRSAKLILRQIKKILRHLLPRKGKAQIVFGLEDPYQMGQILSAAAFLYPFTHDILTLSPVFDEKCLEGEISIKGYIRIGTMLGYVLRLLFDQNIRQQLWRLIRPSRRKKKGRAEG